MERSFAQTLSALRKKQRLSQRKAASDLKISQALLSHYENGAREPGLGFVCKACSYYGVSADYILGLADEEEGRSFAKDGKLTNAAVSCLDRVLNSIDDEDLFAFADRYVSLSVSKAATWLIDNGDAVRLAEVEAQMTLSELEYAKRAADAGLTEIVDFIILRETLRADLAALGERGGANLNMEADVASGVK